MNATGALEGQPFSVVPRGSKTLAQLHPRPVVDSMSTSDRNAGY